MISRDMSMSDIAQHIATGYQKEMADRNNVVTSSGLRRYVTRFMSAEFSYNEMDMVEQLALVIVFPNMSAPVYLLRNVIDTLDGTQVLYWSNDDGWIANRNSATQYSVEERYSVELPMGEPHETITWVFA